VNRVERAVLQEAVLLKAQSGSPKPRGIPYETFCWLVTMALESEVLNALDLLESDGSPR